jgi:hypothetical protein
MALLDTQPDDLEPIEFTHFDCWFDDEDGEGITAQELSDQANNVLDFCEITLHIKIHSE